MRGTIAWLVCLFVAIGARNAAADTPHITFSGTANFGDVTVNPTTPPTATFMLTADMAASGYMNTLQATGLGCGAYTNMHALPLVWLAPNTEVDVTFTFNPTTRGTLDCTFSVIDASDHTTVIGSVALTGRGVAPVIGTTPAPGGDLDFGDVAIGNTGTSTITIRNTGDQTLQIKSVALGTPSTEYTVISPPTPFMIAAGSTQDLTVNFAPDATGAALDTVVIDSSDPATPAVTINLTGNGINARIGVTDVAFGTVAAGGTAQGTITVTNTASAPLGDLSITRADISPTANSWFSFGANGNNCTGLTSCTFPSGGLDVPPNASVSVQCKPPAGATGTQMATVTFTSNSDPSGDDAATLTCTAGVPKIVVMPATLAFGNQTVGTTSATMPFVIMNTGSGTLTYTITGGTTTFPVSASCTTGCSLGAGMMTTVDVAFHPSATGAVSGTINVASNDATGPSKDVMVSGTGVAPMIAMSMTSLDFMTVDVGGTKTLMISAMNSGSSPLTISAAAIQSGSADFAITAGTTGSQMVAVGASVTWSIACAPTVQGALSGTFRVSSNAVGAPTTDVALSCTGQRGKLVTTPISSAGSPLQFGGVAVGNTSQLMFVLSNPGNVDVTGITGTLAPLTAGYSIDASTPIPSTLMAGQMMTIKVNFAPLAGTDGGPATIAISGTWNTHAASVTVFLDGDGLVAGFDVSPATLAFGSLRWDATGTAFFCIVNTDQAPVTVMNPITMTPTSPTVTGEFAVTKIETNASCSATGGSTVTLPQTLASNGTLVVTITADPADRTGALAATATVTTNLPTNPTRTVALTGMSTTGMLTTTPGLVVDFGDVDVDATQPAMQTVRIMNSGDAPLDLSAFSANPATGPFTIALPADQSVPVGGHVDVAISYKPTVEQAPNQFEQVVLTHQVAGVLNGPTMQMITIKGRGVDRHFSLGMAPSFPDTFKNPGSMAPVRTVTVTNNGEAPLTITAAMVTNADVWQLTETGPVTIPGKMAHDFQIKFVPMAAGPAPRGVLTFTNNDNTQPAPVATVNLDGNGLDRNVLMGDPVIDFGFTAIGIPVSHTVTVTSMDATHGFTIRAIDIDDAAFTVDDAPNNVALAAGETKTFTLTFTPTAEGDFTTTAHLFLDEDPTQQAMVTLKGQAVFVEVTGSGGCAAGGGAGGAMVLVIGAALGGMLLRRRRAMFAMLAALVLVPVAVHADTPDQNVDLSLFNPTPSTTGTGFQVQPASVGESGAFAAEATVSYATDPLVLHFTGAEHLAITQRTTMQLGVAYAFLGRFEAGARMPLYNQAGDGSMLGVDSPSGTVRGDLALHAKAKAFEVSNLVAGAGIALTLPTASSHEFAGSSKPTGRVLALVTATPMPRLSLSANAGAVLRAKSELSNIEQGSGFAWGAGASFQLIDELWVTGELFGEVMPSGKSTAMGGSSALAPAEWLVGASYRPDPRFAIGVGVGRGLIAGLGTPSLRGVLSLSYVPGAPLPPPAPKHEHEHETPPPPPPAIDSDGDGIPDDADKCPNEAEDKDMFDDSDGCPDPDNDGDGILDEQDKCPLDAEDKDGFQDEDGCPDKDNDGDGVPDAQDKCPLEAEDKDGYNDVDGCPDPDNDSDGILDAQDKCPNEAEVINGVDDDDGCPDRGDQLVIVTPSGVELSEAVQFQGATIAKASTNVLNQIAATLRAHQEIVRVKIVAHVQPTNNAEKDQDLSDKRASAVAGWLVQWGIPATRLSSAGLGGTKPLVPKAAKNARMINDRVEIIILERK